MAEPSGPRVVKGMPSVELSREEFERRFRERFYDPAFEGLERELGPLVEQAWRSYIDYHKSPRKRKAGPGFADPEFELPLEWLATRAAIAEAEARHRGEGPSRILLVNGSARTD